MADIADLLDEVASFEIPAHLQRFLHRERPPSESERTLSYYSYSYELAFLQLAASVSQSELVYHAIIGWMLPIFLLDPVAYAGPVVARPIRKLQKWS